MVSYLSVRNIVLAVVFSLGLLGSAHGQTGTAPGFTIVQAGPLQVLPMNVAPLPAPHPVFEGPPVIAQANPPLMFSTTGFSWACRLPGGLFHIAVPFSRETCALFSGPARMDLKTGAWLNPHQVKPNANDWRLSYDGVMGAVEVNVPRGPPILLTVAHGENKNERMGSELFPGTVNTDVDPAKCASGMSGGAYTDCWPSYNGFTNVMLTPLKPGKLPDAGDVQDRGPLIWPSMGYVDPVTDRKISYGVRHPSIIVSQGFLYVYYTDTSRGSQPGRQGGLEVARLPLADIPSRLIAVPYFNGKFSLQEPCLPQGFSSTRIEHFFAVPGGRASGLWSGSQATLKFSAAHVRGTPYFLGVEEVLDGKLWRLQLRLSRDLVHWSNPVVIPGETSDQAWAGGNLHYPELSDIAGRSENEIDAAGFVLIGTGAGGHVWQMHLSVDISHQDSKRQY